MPDRRIFVLENDQVAGRGIFNDEAGVPSIMLDGNESLDYVVDWSRWLGSDTIASVTRETNNGITVGTTSNTTTTTTTWLSVPKGYGELTQRITTAAGRIKELVLRIYERDDERWPTRDYGWVR